MKSLCYLCVCVPILDSEIKLTDFHEMWYDLHANTGHHTLILLISYNHEIQHGGRTN